MSVVVIGAGHAGGQLTASLRQLKYEEPITLIGSEQYLPYQRPPLTKEYLRGEFDLDRVILRNQAFYEKNNVDIRLGQIVTGIDRDARTLKLDGGQQLNYETLVLATGSRPIKPPIPGIDLTGVHLLRTIDDVDGIAKHAESADSVVVIGGGYIGLEAAASLRASGKNVAVVEMEDRLLKRVATESLSTFFTNLHTQQGVDLHLHSQVTKLQGDEHDAVASVELSDGSALPANLVIVGVGIVPITELAESAGLTVDNGIHVDETCRTADEHIYAVGDCTNHPNPLLDRRLRLESVPNATEQSRVAATNITGTTMQYASYPWFWSDQFDVKLQMVGFAADRDESVTRKDDESGSTIEFHLKAGVLVAADAINSPREFLAARQLCGKTVDPKALADVSVDMRSLL